jgi:hypothetical protein
LFFDTLGGVMKKRQLDSWLRLLRHTATVVYIAALCVAVALLVIAVIPGSPVMVQLPSSRVSGGLHGIAPDVIVQPAGQMAVKLSDPSLPQRMPYLATMLPGLLLVAEVARRMANVLRNAQDNDPFTVQTAQVLTLLAKLTAVGGVGVWAVNNAAKAALSVTVLDSGAALKPHQTPVAWLAVALILAAFAQLITRGLAMRAELDTFI